MEAEAKQDGSLSVSHMGFEAVEVVGWMLRNLLVLLLTAVVVAVVSVRRGPHELAGMADALVRSWARGLGHMDCKSRNHNYRCLVGRYPIIDVNSFRNFNIVKDTYVREIRHLREIYSGSFAAHRGYRPNLS